MSGLMQSGDFILEVDGRKIAGMHSKDVKALIRGPSGSTITLKAQRPGAGSGPYEVALTRGGGEADQSLPSMSETASSVGGGSVVGAAGKFVGREVCILPYTHVSARHTLSCGRGSFMCMLSGLHCSACEIRFH